MKIGCVLLAAGAGKRFGGGKLLYEVEGEPMIAHALRLFGSIPFASRVCVARRADRAIQTLAQERGFAVVINPDPERGVGTGLWLRNSHGVRLNLRAHRQGLQLSIAADGLVIEMH